MTTLNAQFPAFIRRKQLTNQRLNTCGYKNYPGTTVNLYLNMALIII